MNIKKINLWFVCMSIWLITQNQAAAVSLNGYLPPVRLNGAFTLTDQNGQNFSSRQLSGNYTLLVFGYTHCTDICPTALRDALQVQEALSSKIPVQVVFITLDPERDTPEVMAQYVNAYDREIVALSGDLRAITEVAQRYRMKFRKQPSKKRPGAYAIDHNTYLYLLDKKTRPLVLYPYGTALDDIIGDLKLLNQNGQGVVTGKMFNKAGMMDH